MLGMRATAWVIAGTLLGLAAGGSVGGLLVHRQNRDETGRLADMYIERAARVSAEAVEALERANRSPEAICSDADITNLRKIVITSQFLKAMSRVRGRQMLCGSLLGRLDTLLDLPDPDIVTDRGRRVQFDTPVIGIPDVRVMVIEQGNTSAVVGRDTYASLVDPRLDYTVVADYNGKRNIFMSSGPAIPVGDRRLVSGTSLRVEGRRYEVRCSADRTGCIVAALKNPMPALHSPVLLGFCAFGWLAGLGGGIGISSALARSRSMGRRLRKALRAGELKIVYQPIVRLADRRRMGAEALLRWKDEEGLHINPDVFIAVAEEEGLICDITRFVVRRVLAELGGELKHSPGFQVTINVSARDLLDNTFCAFVKGELRRTQVPARNIGFEITERSTADRQAINRGIQQLRQAGHKVYIDDFGAAYSSLAYLAHLRVDAIKLDRTFTVALDDDLSESIVPQIVEMSKVLGLTLVVEGIEKEAQARYFLDLDPAALGQGWLFGKPLAADSLFTSS